MFIIKCREKSNANAQIDQSRVAMVPRPLYSILQTYPVDEGPAYYTYSTCLTLLADDVDYPPLQLIHTTPACLAG
jgi:hypothetical protein